VLAGERGGGRWTIGGIGWPAVVAQVVGMAAGLMWTDAKYYVPSYVGPLSRATGGADFSWLLGIVVGGLVYLALAGRQVGESEVALGH
jgi:NCS1 family nucleobase:cation symporter-1